MNRISKRAGRALAAALLGVCLAAGAGAASAPLDLNSASVAELQALPGVGPTRARAIVELRSARGGFHRVDELLDVKGIGEAGLERLRPLVGVGARGAASGAGKAGR